MYEPDWNAIELRKVIEQELRAIRDQIASIQLSIDRQPLLTSMKGLLLVTDVILGLILWRLWG
jgi:hypothetical protein